MTSYTGIRPTNRMPVAPVIIFDKSCKKSVSTYAVLDCAATDNLCSEELAQLLGVRGDAVYTTVVSATGTSETETSHWVSLLIRGYHTANNYSIKALAMQSFTDLSSHIPSKHDLTKYPHLRGLTIPSHPRKKVDLIIGIGESPLHFTHDSRTGSREQLWASLSGLGWVIHGQDVEVRSTRLNGEIPVNSVQIRGASPDHLALSQDEELLTLVRRSLALDFDEPQHTRMRQPSRVEQKMLTRQKASIKLRNGRYEVALLWKHNSSALPNNYVMAYRCLQHLGRRLVADKVLLEKYKDFINKLIENNQAEIAPTKLSYGIGVWYLTHHPVLKKFRVVFNGKAAFGGKALNSCLDKGPEHTSTLLGTLLRFRQYKYAVTADIKGMFYNVSVPDQERDFLRFLYWEAGDPTKPVVEYRLSHQVPGLTCSGSNACFVLRHLADKNPTRAQPITLASIRTNFYMDDWLPSFPDLKSLQLAIREIIVALQAAGFRLTKFVSNERAALTDVPLEDHAPEADMTEPGAKSDRKTLGIGWDTSGDRLGVKVSMPSQPATRRGVLAAVMSPFDPCGMLLPFLLDMKLLLQRLFKLKLNWDDPLPAKERKEWDCWLQQLPALANISCPRVLIPKPNFEHIWLCNFSDASEKGYAAVSYIVCNYGACNNVAFALGKVRVAPSKKQLTMPRLELLGAVLAAEVASSIQEELHNVKFDHVYFWTDSITVLHYVDNPTLRLKAFVANRVGKVLELTAGATWSHVRTHENSADIGSRGLRPQDTESINPWLAGPAFLKEAQSKWPLTKESGEITPAPVLLEIKSNLTVADTSPCIKVEILSVLFNRYSTLRKLQTTAAWLLRFRGKLRKISQTTVQNTLSAFELKGALLALIRTAQWASYPQLMQALGRSSATKDLPPAARQQWTSMKSLNPFLDEEGLLRVGGRLQNAGLSYSQTHPLVLPRRHALTGFLVRHCHVNSAHMGFRYVLGKLRECYWVIGGTATVRHYLLGCLPCRHANATPGAQQMAPLPPSRFQIGLPAFSYAAVDYFGPINVMVRRRPEKRWGCLITCLTTRAVYLDVAHTLNAQSFLMTFRRFLALYPTVQEMLSDNGSNFHSADKQLQSDFKKIDLDRVAKGLKPEGVDFRWRFNPPAASHQGGVFERLIGIVRKCLRQIMADASYRTPTDEVLLTMLSEIAGIINSRPLLPAGHDPDSFDVLTPAQIIRPGTPAVPMVVRCFSDVDALRNGYKSSQWHTQEFWRRFQLEYIPLLQKRARWLHAEQNFAVGDLVLMKDKDAPRYQWKKARIVKTLPNTTDGLVRRVRLRLADRSELERDIRYLCQLETTPLIANK